MTYETREFFRAACDYPGCVEHHTGEYPWWYRRTFAMEAVQDDPFWLVMDDDTGVARFFCPRHVQLDESDQPVLFDDEDHLPVNAELIPGLMEASWDNPLPKPECEDTILRVLKGQFTEDE